MQTWTFVRHKATMIVAVGAAMIVIAPASAALAADGSDAAQLPAGVAAPLAGSFVDGGAESSVVDQVTNAVSVEQAAPAADNPAVNLPDTASDGAGLALGDGRTLTMDLPAEGSGSGTQPPPCSMAPPRTQASSCSQRPQGSAR